jgi:hypothetical protein
VPVVAEAKGGWNEMQPGVLAETIFYQSKIVERMATSETVRNETMDYGRNRMTVLSDPAGGIAQQWVSLFEELASTD